MPDPGISAVNRYLTARALPGPWQLAGCTDACFTGAIVIPSLAERVNLAATLGSLAANPPELLERFLVVVVVNNRADASADYKADNVATLDSLASVHAQGTPLHLAWVDAAQDGRELPVKGGGVGMARKIGLDLTLQRLAHDRRDPILVSLDADTLVLPNYLETIVAHFEKSTAGGMVIPFRHQHGDSPAQQAAIDRYELFLRTYVLGLRHAGSPYAFHTVGSALACRASAYVKMGGMNVRAAGEDFYFLQQLHRITGVEQMHGTVVFPSCRPSDRVPFGTGRSMARLLSREEGAVLFYRPECFTILQKWLATALDNRDRNGKEVLALGAAISPHLGRYLAAIRLEQVWDRLRHTHREECAFARAFHEWFDGLKTMKLIHHLSEACYPRCEPEKSVPGLLELCKVGAATGIEQQLSLLRKLQGAVDGFPVPAEGIDYSPI